MALVHMRGCKAGGSGPWIGKTRTGRPRLFLVHSGALAKTPTGSGAANRGGRGRSGPIALGKVPARRNHADTAGAGARYAKIRNKTVDVALVVFCHT